MVVFVVFETPSSLHNGGWQETGTILLPSTFFCLFLEDNTSIQPLFISSENQRDAYPITIKLIENGRFAYIAEWSYKGKSWKRLRTGFFKDQQTAVGAGRDIVKALNLQTFWAVEAEWEEVCEYAGFAECLLP